MKNSFDIPNVPEIEMVDAPCNGMTYIVNPKLYPEGHLHVIPDTLGALYEYDKTINCMMFKGYEINKGCNV